ncbi:hypothetical protein ARSEF4850_001514 [Beauveria asiatica]
MPPADTAPKTGRLKHDGRVTFGFLEDITTPDCDMTPSCGSYIFKNLKNVPWYTELTLKVNDVAVLLKNGLFWSEDNIDSTDNFFADDNDAPQGRAVYHFDRVESDRCFNAILDDTPLEGWWPWPKKEDMNANTMQGAMDDDSTQEDLDVELKQEDIDGDSMQ